jgi:predicted ATPase/DNA-binding XRE family transcriptional regulator
VTEDSPQSFAGLLRRLRESAGLSQEELAERARLSSHAVSALERGVRTRPYPHTVRALADALSASEAQRAALLSAVPSRRKATPTARDAAPTATSRSLPTPTTPMLGREEDLARVVALLRRPDHRLVTITGTGGVGKTRLSLAVAEAVAPSLADPVVLVELAQVLEAAAVLPAIADAVDAAASDGHDPVTSIRERFGDRPALLVLDNLEHLLDAAPEIARLLSAAPALTMLVTSRAPLRVRGEVEVPLEPLALPRGTAASDLESSPAVQLFLDRARAVSPRWAKDPDDAAAVALICTRLDGIPLALELAAARSRLLDPASLLGRLGDSGGAGARDLPPRQRTMRATLDWSYDLLDAPEQALLRLASVFVGGFRIDDFEAVVARVGRVDRHGVFPVLESLAEQSLVWHDRDAVPARYRLLEPVAQYARARSVEADEWETAARAHAEHFLELAELAAPQYQRGEQVSWLARVDAEHANMAAAMERCQADGSTELVARFGWALWLYWWLRGHHGHGRRHMEDVLRHDLPDGIRAQAELAAATMAFAMDDVTASRRWWLAAEGRTSPDDEPVSHANAVAGVGLAALATGDLDTAEERFRRAEPVAEAAGPPAEWTAALNQVWLGTVMLLRGDPDRAAAHIERGLASARRRGDRLTSYVALYNLSQVESARGAHPQARRHLADGMRLSLETGDHANLAYFLDAQAVLEAADGVHARVPILTGAAQAIREAIGARGYGYYRPDPQAHAAAVDEARRHLGADRYDDALDVGRTLSPADAVGLGLDEPHR